MSTVKVRYGKEVYLIENVGSYQELEDLVRTKTQIESVKLVWRGRVLGEGDAIPSTVLAIGSSEEKISEMERGAEEYQLGLRQRRERDVVNDLNENILFSTQDDETATAVLRPSLSEINPRNGSETGFGRIETLPGFGDSQKAAEILDNLARDVGIRQVMRRHDWYVPTLSEMAPEGKVGVDPVCVLGLNENKGQRILLRLRTDDRLGFRKILTIKKVLYHELAHNERSQHDAIFYGLVSRIEHEAEAASSNAKTNSHRLGGQSFFRRRPQASSTPPSFNIAMRLGHSLPTPDGGYEEEKTPILEQPPLQSLEEHQHSNTENIPLYTELQEPEDMGGANSIKSLETKSTLNTPATPPFSDIEPFFEPSSRETKILQASRDLLAVDDIESRREAATTLQLILHNAAQPEEKYKRVRMKNKRFMRTAGKYAAALRFLEACGFHREQEDNEELLVLRRQDPGLLWAGRSALETIVAC